MLIEWTQLVILLNITQFPISKNNKLQAFRVNRVHVLPPKTDKTAK